MPAEGESCPRSPQQKSKAGWTGPRGAAVLAGTRQTQINSERSRRSQVAGPAALAGTAAEARGGREYARERLRRARYHRPTADIRITQRPSGGCPVCYAPSAEERERADKARDRYQPPEPKSGVSVRAEGQSQERPAARSPLAGVGGGATGVHADQRELRCGLQ